MGQCVLRDIGFEFEDDPKRQKAFEAYLKEKSNVKYPDLYLPKTAANEEDEEENERNESPKSFKTADQLFGRVTTLLNKMVQTDDLDDEYLLNLDDNVQVEAIAAVSHTTPKNMRNQGYEDEMGAHKQFRPQETLKLSSSGFLESTPPATSATKALSPNIRATLAKMPPVGSTANIFDGLESIDFRSPMNKDAAKAGFNFNQQQPPANNEALPLRSRMAQYKGFENKYFRISHNRSPSPMAQSENIFEDDDDDFPYDDY